VLGPSEVRLVRRERQQGSLEPVYSIEFLPACPAFECGDDAVKLSRMVIVAHMSD